MPEFTDWGQPAVETAAGDTSGPDGRIWFVPITSSDLQSERRSMPELTDWGQPAVETAAGDTSRPGGKIYLVHITSSDLQSERRIKKAVAAENDDFFLVILQC
jgi:hypothetical protein